jgi:YD repeat-containing protein
MDPDESHVWLLTRFGSFREFGSLGAGSGLRLYQTVTPGDEYRKLYYDSTAQGWQLVGLDGSVEYFLPKTAGSPAGMLAGFFDKITDRLYDPANPAAHPPVQATYNASNQLDHVTLPDGRRENFSYTGGASGKLASLTEVGTDGTTTRTWTFTWNGDDLVTIGRPDICPGLSVGTSCRAGAHGTRKARVRQVTGECPSCVTTANPAFTYADPANPLLPTTVTDGRGVATSFTYNANGRQLTKVETVQTTPALVQRQTTWTYNATFPSFVSTVTGPFSPPGTPPAGTRAFRLSYDPKGNLLTSTISGSEATYPTGTFSLQTAYGNYSAAGLPGLINPPDVPSTTTDATTYTFKPGATNGYDGAGRLSAMARQASCAATQPLEQTLYTLDAAGHRILEVRQRLVSGSPVTDATISYNYSTACHLDSMTAGDPNNPSLQSTTQFQYDCNNDMISAWDPKHNQPAAPSTSYVYDPLNRLTQVLRPWGGAGGGTAVTTYAYDLEDHLSSVTDSERNQTTYVTSDRDLLTRQTSPVTGMTSYVYNAHGALVQQTDARGVVMTRQLDPADRPTQVTYTGDPTLTTTYAYDATSVTGTFPIGRLSSITKGTGVAASVVSPQGDTPLLKTIILANNAGTKYFIFDRAGNELLAASPTSHLELNPDPAGKLTRMTEATQRTTTTLAYDGRGFLAKARNSATDCGPLLTTTTYSSDGLLYHRQQQASSPVDGPSSQVPAGVGHASARRPATRSRSCSNWARASRRLAASGMRSTAEGW